MPVLKVDRILLRPPVVGSLLPVLPVDDVVVPGLARMLVGLSCEGGGVVKGQLSDLDMGLTPDRTGGPGVPHLHVLGEWEVGARCGLYADWLSHCRGWFGLWPYEAPGCVLWADEVVGGLGGDVLDWGGEIAVRSVL